MWAIISDFGCAALVGSTGQGGSSRLVRGLAKPGGVGLTVNYAAPELFERIGTIHQSCTAVDKKLDVYAFGVTVLELFSRQDPWATTTRDIQEIIKKVVRGERPAIEPSLRQTLAAAGEERIISLVEACWSHNPLHRPSFTEALAILRRKAKPQG